MARAPNPFSYQDPSAAIGSNLAQAIFGDPKLRQQAQAYRATMALREAQAQEARAQAANWEAKTQGYDIQNGAAQSLPELMAGLTPRPAATPIPVDVDSQAGTPSFADAFDSSVGPAAHPETQQAAIQRGLPLVLAAMGQMNGDNIDPRQIMGTLAAFAGDDELARRGLVAQGQTPGKDFALTPGRADAISARDAAEDQTQAFGVANIDAVSRRGVADIGASATRYAADRRRDASAFAASERARRESVKAKAHPVGLTATKALLKEMKDQLGDIETTPEIRSYLLEQASGNYAASGNPIGALRSAILKARGNYQRQKAAKQTENSSTVPTLTPEQAKQLPKGSKFKTQDGRVLVRQ